MRYVVHFGRNFGVNYVTSEIEGGEALTQVDYDEEVLKAQASRRISQLLNNEEMKPLSKISHCLQNVRLYSIIHGKESLIKEWNHNGFIQ